MTTLFLLVLTLLAAYLVGAIPFGYLVARGRGVDILRQGSGNIGATNVGRLLGRRYGILVFLLDFAKGALPVLTAKLCLTNTATQLPPDSLPVAAAIAAFLGHLFPVYLRFRGGKGVATGAGAVAVLLPDPMLAALLAWFVVFVSTRYVSLASLCAGVVLCVLRLALTPQPWAADQMVVTLFCLLAVALVFVRHHANIRRLLQGQENRVQESSTMLLLSKTLHVLALGLWFGTAVFFLIIGWSLFQTFASLTRDTEQASVWWLPQPVPEGKGEVDGEMLAHLRKEQGTRLAGEAIRPLFHLYFGIQGLCAVLALAPTLAWLRRARRVDKVRVLVLVLALVSVIGGFQQERKVSALRALRDASLEPALRLRSPQPQQVQLAKTMRNTFNQQHGISMIINFITLLLVTLAMALAAQLPTGVPRAPEPRQEEYAAKTEVLSP